MWKEEQQSEGESDQGRVEAANSPNILIIILIQTQRATGMLHKQLQNTDFVLFDLWHLFIHGVGDEVTAS